jgi:BirA family biotin operon repressor/biotin-[acetyl-CoA-carboxylase] ligase
VPGSLTFDWPVQRWVQELHSLVPGMSVDVVSEVESTNSALVERARLSLGLAGGKAGSGSLPGLRRSDDCRPGLLVAELQTRGRGRLGRAWQAQRGCSLTFSVSLPLAPVDWSGLSLAVGVAVADALEPVAAGGSRLGLKWPNDLWLIDEASSLGGRKLGGVLIETVALGQRRMCVVGVGLNVRPWADAGGTSGFAAWSEVEPDVSLPAVLDRVLLPVVSALLSFEQDGFVGVKPRFDQRDVLRERDLELLSGGRVVQGVSLGVDARGVLQVRLPDGSVSGWSTGEVTVRPLRQAGAGALG